MVHLPTYLPTYQPTRQPTGSVSPPSPSLYPSLCVRASLRDIVSPRLSFTLVTTSRFLRQVGLLTSLSLFTPITFSSPAPFHYSVIATTPRALSRLSALSVRPRATQLYLPTHSAYSPPCTQPPLVAASPASSRLTAPRHATPLLSPFPPRAATTCSESRLTNLQRALADIPLRPRGSPTGGISHASREDLDKEHQTIAGRC